MEIEISEDVAKEEFGLTQEDINELVQESTQEVEEEEVVEQKEPPKPSKHESEASELGWVSQDEWVAKGKDPEDWKPAKAFLEINKLHKSVDEKINKLAREHQEAIQGLNKFHELQLLDTIKKLTLARDNAVETGDLEAFKAIDSQLEQVKQVQPTQPVNEKPFAVQEWEKANPWCHDPLDERTILANALFKSTVTLNPNMTLDARLKYVDDTLSLKFPKTNARREAPAATEPSAKQTAKKTYTLADLSNSERAQWHSFGKDWYDNDEQKFIKAAIAARNK